MTIVEIAIAAALLGLLAFAWFGGKRLGREMSGALAEHPQFGVVQGAIVGLLSLLLGFCFAGALARFVERQEVLGREACAICSMYDVAALIPDPDRTKIRDEVRAYALLRRELFARSRIANEHDLRDELRADLASVWDVTSRLIEGTPALAAALTGAYIELSDSLGTRNALEDRHMPSFVFVLLVFCAAASVSSVGMGVEISDQRLRRPAMVLIFLIAATLWMTLDLDFPRLGLIQLNGRPLDDAVRCVGGAIP